MWVFSALIVLGQSCLAFRDFFVINNSFLGRLSHAPFIRSYAHVTFLYGNDQTEFSKKVKIFVKPPIRRKSAGIQRLTRTCFWARIGEEQDLVLSRTRD